MRNIIFSMWAVFSLTLAPVVQAQSAEKIIIDGSTGVTPLVAALAKAYREQNPGAAIDIGKGMGTRARIEALRDGKIDIAMANHGLKVDDIKRQGMAVHEIAKIAVVFGVNASVPLTSINDAQICDIYSLKTANWKGLGAADLAIVPVTRPDSEVDTEVVREKIACLTKLQMPDNVKVAPKAGEMAEALATTIGAVGMTTMTVVEQSNGRIKAMALQGVTPTAANVQNKSYTLTRDSFLVTQASPSSAVAKFMAFVASDAGKKVIAANGAVPVK
jgi:phosphate transport system substrate-binding protein